MKALAVVVTVLDAAAWIAAIVLGYAAIFGHDWTLGGAAFLSLTVALFGAVAVGATWSVTVIRDEAGL